MGDSFNSLVEYYKNLKGTLCYIKDFSIKKRKDRLVTCCYWNNIEMQKIEDYKNKYENFIKLFENKTHKDWCLYYGFNEKNWKQIYSDEPFEKHKNIRENVKDLGIALHYECHYPLELIQNRLIGAKDSIFDWNKMNDEGENLEEQIKLINFLNKIGLNINNFKINVISPIEITLCTKNTHNNGDMEYNLIKENNKIKIKDSSDREIYEFLVKQGNGQLNVYNQKKIHEELFRRLYHEIRCFKNSLLSEIYSKENQMTSSRNFLLFYVSLLIMVGIAFDQGVLKNFGNYHYLILLFLVLLILAYFYFAIRNWIKLNEAKDALYICKGIDIDERIDRGNSIRYEESGK